MRRRKVYVTVDAEHLYDGRCVPKSILFGRERLFNIQKVKKCEKNAHSLNVNGSGTRYTVIIGGREAVLYDELNGRWFVEAKC